MHIKKLRNSNDAIVGIVVTILLIGLIVCVISIIQTVYIPKWMEQTEAEHMDVVADQFAQMKSAIDIQGAIGLNQQVYTPISTGITLGSREFPFLMSARAFGSLNILPDTSYRVVIKDKNGGISDNSSATIQYSSSNAYFLDQSYTYEAGAMIVSQSQGNLMMIPPSFFVDYNQMNNTVTISFDVVNISSVGNKTIASGFGTYPIQTEFHDISTNIIFTNVRNITIKTPYSNAWFVFINHSLMGANLNHEGYGTQFLLTDTGKALKLDFPSSGISPTVNISFKIIEIQAQIGPGWIE
jgi:hypothetical protein